LESNKYDFQGSQVSLICWDEVTQFSESMFWYLLSRCRSMSGISGYMRATCNPDPDSWVRRLLSCWIDDKAFPIRERSGVLRWFIRIDDEMIWGDSKTEPEQRFGPDCSPRSLTFVPALVHDNALLLQKDPNYLANLRALGRFDKATLLLGNWDTRPESGMFFKRADFEIVDKAPTDVIDRVRFWDRAATVPTPSNPDPDWSVGLLLSKDASGIYYVEDVERLRESGYAVAQRMLRCANRDGIATRICFLQDPASAGKFEAEETAKFLDGWCISYHTATGDKQTRVRPISAQAEAGNVKIVRGDWNEAFLRELESFPSALHDDQCDGLSGGSEFIRNYTSGITRVERDRNDPFSERWSLRRAWRDAQQDGRRNLNVF
jgi:predicted phage terminase large subunit-like protein